MKELNTASSDSEDETSDNLPSAVPPSAEEKQAFLTGLQKIFPKAAVTSAYFLRQRQDDRPGTKKLPRTISSYYHPKYCHLSHNQLERESLSVFKEMKVTEDESQYLAKCTQLQAQSSLWFEHRKARLTASRFRAICHTRVEKPAESLVKQILQKAPLPKCASLSWGVENEVKARQQYKKMMSQSHVSFEVQTTGLHINPK